MLSIRWRVEDNLTDLIKFDVKSFHAKNQLDPIWPHWDHYWILMPCKHTRVCLCRSLFDHKSLPANQFNYSNIQGSNWHWESRHDLHFDWLSNWSLKHHVSGKRENNQDFSHKNNVFHLSRQVWTSYCEKFFFFSNTQMILFYSNFSQYSVSPCVNWQRTTFVLVKLVRAWDAWMLWFYRIVKLSCVMFVCSFWTISLYNDSKVIRKKQLASEVTRLPWRRQTVDACLVTLALWISTSLCDLNRM